MKDKYIKGTKTSKGYVIWGNSKFSMGDITKLKGVSISSVLVALREWDITINEFMTLPWTDALALANSRKPEEPVKKRAHCQAPSFADKETCDKFLFGGLK
jgi:hypothetical protein